MRKKRRKKSGPLSKRLARLEKRVDRLAVSSGLPSLPATFRSADFGTPTARYSSRATMRHSAPPSTESYSARAIRPTMRSGE